MNTCVTASNQQIKEKLGVIVIQSNNPPQEFVTWDEEQQGWRRNIVDKPGETTTKPLKNVNNSLKKTTKD